MNDDDYKLIENAKKQLENVYEPIWHTVASGIRLKSGEIFTGVNVDTSTGSGGGACAEMSALSAVISAGKKSEIETIVAVGKEHVLPPCGVCRQMLMTHAPQVQVIIPVRENLKKVSLTELMPYTDGLKFGDIDS